MNWQYFSKLHNRWIDAKTSDRKDALLKCGYKIRPLPVFISAHVTPATVIIFTQAGDKVEMAIVPLSRFTTE